MTGWLRRLPWLFFGEVVRSLAGVLLVVLVAVWWGSPGAALAAGAAAAIAGAVSLEDSPRGRVPSVLWASAEMAAAVLIGSLTLAHSVLFVGVAMVWCFAAGMLWALGANSGLVAAASSALLVTAPNLSVSFGHAAATAGLAAVGGLVQALLIVVWPRRRWAVQRRALAAAYRSVAAHARLLADDADAVADRSALVFLREAFTLTERQVRRRPEAFRSYYGLPERIDETITALAPLRRAEAQGPVADVLRVAADVLDAVAVGSGDAGVAHALDRLDATAAEIDGAAAESVLRLRSQLHEAAALRFPHGQPRDAEVQSLRRPVWERSVAPAAAVIRAQLTWSSPVLRHAIRLAVGIGLGMAVARIWGIPHGYWLPLTVLMVMRHDRVHTFTRAAQRVTGNLVGIAVATVIAMTWHPAGTASAALAVLFLGVAYAVSTMGYLALSAALAAAIVFLIDINSVAGPDTLAQRLIATAIGGAVAIGVHAMVPDPPLGGAGSARRHDRRQ